MRRPRQVPADWVLHNGYIGGADDGAEAVAIAGGRVAARGSDSEVLRMAAPGTTTVTDLDGATVLPGFVDTHMHFEKIARELAMVHFEGTDTLEDALGLLADAARHSDLGDFVEVFGSDPLWHEGQWPERRLPTRRELDSVAGDAPVVVFRGPDAAVLSSRAIEALRPVLLAVPTSAWDPQSGWVRGPHAKAVCRSVPAPEGQRAVELLANASRCLLELGITAVLDPGIAGRFDESWKLYRTAREQGVLSQRVSLMNRVVAGTDLRSALRDLERAEAIPGEGDERLRAGGLKVLLDGEIADAWMRPGEQRSSRSTRHHTTSELLEATNGCLSRGWPLCVHAVGGGAIDAALTAFDGARRGNDVAPGQLSLAHALFPSRANLEQCQSRGIVLSVQPALLWAYGGAMTRAWGDRATRAMPLRTILDHGVEAAGGSDVLPCDPLLGATTAVERRVQGDLQFDMGEAVTPSEAIDLFTRGTSAYAEAQGMSGVGTLAVGTHADLAVWPSSPDRQLTDTAGYPAPSLVAVGGTLVHGSVCR